MGRYGRNRQDRFSRLPFQMRDSINSGRFDCLFIVLYLRILLSDAISKIIPREDGKIRIYVQLPPQDYAKTQNGRLKKSSLDSSAVQSSVLAIGLSNILVA